MIESRTQRARRRVLHRSDALVRQAAQEHQDRYPNGCGKLTCELEDNGTSALEDLETLEQGLRALEERDRRLASNVRAWLREPAPKEKEPGRLALLVACIAAVLVVTIGAGWALARIYS